MLELCQILSTILFSIMPDFQLWLIFIYSARIMPDFIYYARIMPEKSLC